MKVNLVFAKVRIEDEHVLLIDVLLETRITNSISNGLLFVDALGEHHGVHSNHCPILQAFWQLVVLAFFLIK